MWKKRICKNCGMIRAIKDMVLLEDGTYICFSCWNKRIRERGNQN